MAAEERCPEKDPKQSPKQRRFQAKRWTFEQAVLCDEWLDEFVTPDWGS